MQVGGERLPESLKAKMIWVKNNLLLQCYLSPVLQEPVTVDSHWQDQDSDGDNDRSQAGELELGPEIVGLGIESFS